MDGREGRPLYLDAQATTSMDPRFVFVPQLYLFVSIRAYFNVYRRVLDAMLPYMTALYGNPHSRTHAYGWESETAVEAAREVCNAIIGTSIKVSNLSLTNYYFFSPTGCRTVDWCRSQGNRFHIGSNRV